MAKSIKTHNVVACCKTFRGDNINVPIGSIIQTTKDDGAVYDMLTINSIPLDHMGWEGICYMYPVKPNGSLTDKEEREEFERNTFAEPPKKKR